MSKNSDHIFASDIESSGNEDLDKGGKKKKSTPAAIRKRKLTSSSSSNYRSKNSDPVLQSDDAFSEIEDGEIVEASKKRSKPPPSSAAKKVQTTYSASAYRSQNTNRDNERVEIQEGEVAAVSKKKGKSSASAIKKPMSPIPSTSKYKQTVADLFGEDSEGENASPSIFKDSPKLPCYLTRRVANGYAKQFHPDKKGAMYIELKIYQSSEIEKISPMNRWRQAIVSLKTRDSNNSESWRYLSKYVKEARAQFESCHTSFTNYS